jgi:hypothetical protein
MNKSHQIFKTPEGVVKYSPVDSSNRYEYGEDDDPLWKLSDNWISLDILRASQFHSGYGKVLLQKFISALPGGSGIVLNVTSLDEQVSNEYLEEWYHRQGFKEVSDSNTTLFYIKALDI